MRVYKLKTEKNSYDRDKVITEYTPFIVKTIAEETKRYVEVENSEELSIAILAFNEAIDRYEYNESNFLSYAKIVILSRIRTHLKSNNFRTKNVVSLDQLSEKGETDMDNKAEDIDDSLVAEIEEFKHELFFFGLDLEKLIDESPKHKDTRIKAILLGQEVSKVNEIVKKMYLKRKLPIATIVDRFKVSLKFVKRSKSFLISVIIINNKKLELIKNWIKK